MFAVSGLLCDYGKHFISYDLLFIMIFVGIEIYEMKFTSHFFKKLKYHEIAIYFKHFFLFIIISCFDCLDYDVEIKRMSLNFILSNFYVDYFHPNKKKTPPPPCSAAYGDGK